MNGVSTLFFILTVLVSLTAKYRKLHAEFNPGCPIDVHCEQISKLVYVRSEDDNDTVHFLFDFSSKPSLVILTTDRDSFINVNYTTGSEDNTIQFTKPPKYTYASVFNNLYEFNDISDTALIENNENLITMYFKQFQWNMTTFKNTSEFVEVTITAVNYRAANVSKSGTISVTLRVYGSKNQEANLPHFIHTPKFGKLTLTLDNLKIDNSQSRFAVELLSFSSFPFNKSEDLSINSFFYDKLSGRTFLNFLVDTKSDDQKEGGGYVSWNPVAYKAPNPHALDYTYTIQYDICDHSDVKDWISSPLIKLYGNRLFTDNSLGLKKAFNVSFGVPEDNFYAKSNYLYWSFVVGVDGPSNKSLGLLEELIIAILLLMLTIIVILMICGFCGFCVFFWKIILSKKQTQLNYLRPIRPIIVPTIRTHPVRDHAKF